MVRTIIAGSWLKNMESNKTAKKYNIFTKAKQYITMRNQVFHIQQAVDGPRFGLSLKRLTNLYSTGNQIGKFIFLTIAKYK